ncbi:MAG TPA: hypothetical protein PKC72_04065 [Chitinophagaceae bacterium]|nr:hypothetical protein [Chitinophagaceae bacterium]
MKFLKFLLVVLFIFLVGCKKSGNPDEPFVNNKLNNSWLEKIIRNSDSTHTKPYFRREFVTASYYINKKDSTLCQVMRDSSEKVRQVIITKNDIRTFFSQYYPNGQAVFINHLKEDGKFEGDAVNYYLNGKVKSKGEYHDGLYSGVWEYYDENGRLIRKEEYDSNGQRIKTDNF